MFIQCSFNVHSMFVFKVFFNYAFCILCIWLTLKWGKWRKSSIKNGHAVDSLNIRCRSYWMWTNKITLPVFSVPAGSDCWLQYRLIFWKPVKFCSITTLHSLCQDCIRKFPGQHYKTNIARNSVTVLSYHLFYTFYGHLISLLLIYHHPKLHGKKTSIY